MRNLANREIIAPLNSIIPSKFAVDITTRLDCFRADLVGHKYSGSPLIRPPIDLSLVSSIGNANLIGLSSMWRALLEHYKNKGCFIKDSE
jgi:hypothetical protein